MSLVILRLLRATADDKTIEDSENLLFSSKQVTNLSCNEL